MKKVFALLAVISTLVAGCSTTSPTPPNKNLTTSAPTNQTAANVTNTQNTTNPTTVAAQTNSAVAGTTTTAGMTQTAYIVEKQFHDPQNDISYPQIVGMSETSVESRVNQYLKQHSVYTANSNDPGTTIPHTYTSDYNVVWRQGNVVNILLNSYYYSQGAAHGMPGRESIMLDIRTGKIYHIADLFKPGSPYLQRISDLVRQQDTEHVLNSFQTFTGFTNQDGVYLTQGGFRVFFSPYEWTPYALGFPEFTIPYTKVSDLVDTGGDFWKALQIPTNFDITQDTKINAAKIKSLGYVPESSMSTSAPDGSGNLVYAFAAYPQAVTDGSVEKVFFFLGQHYLGTDTLKDHGPVLNVSPVGIATIGVRYETNAEPLEISYQWNGSVLQPNRAFPPSYTEWSSK